MIPIQQLGISLLLIVLCSCNSPQPDVYFSDIKALHIKNYNSDFSKYCKIDSAHNFELNAVSSIFFGDHKKSIAFATKAASNPQPFLSSSGMSESEILSIKNEVENKIEDTNVSKEERIKAQYFLNILDQPDDLNEVFDDKKMVAAKEFIVEKAKDYHFLLINEAHYSAQNRAFTKELLKPLWQEGYRYLALEALGYEDTLLMERGYPIFNTGYYIKESVFGNLVREALEIGFELITYETKLGVSGTVRDRDQAVNIYSNTWQKDSTGKVLIHAGYSHISETGDEIHKPMGSQLRKMANQDVLTVDQQNMTALLDNKKLHPYYRFATKNFGINEPVVFVDNNNHPLVDPINASGIDIQVYHPVTTYIKGRPTWRLTENTKLYELPNKFEKYEGYLIQVVKKGEETSTIPFDQFIIDGEKALILPTGEYVIRLINCNGTLHGISNLRITNPR